MSGRSIRLDPHVHTSPASRCGKLPVGEVVRRYAERGYDAIVLTNHYPSYSLERDGRGVISFEKAYSTLMADYRCALEEGERAGLRVFFGAELRFADSLNDYLIYGVTPDSLAAMAQVYAAPPRMYPFVKPEGSLIFQAHPFRDGMTRAEPELIDGVEVFNGHPGHDSRNALALAWAREHGKLMISGSDAHFDEAIGRSGILLPEMPADEAGLAAMLRAGLHRLIVPDGFLG